MTKDESTYADLLSEVFGAHSSLQGLPAARAELQYIKDVQLMDGYGCDFYVAKVRNSVHGKTTACRSQNRTPVHVRRQMLQGQEL